MAEIHEGGCLCRAVRYRVVGKPIEAMICHCTLCQRRTGMRLGCRTYFNEKDVEFTWRGDSKPMNAAPTKIIGGSKWNFVRPVGRH